LYLTDHTEVGEYQHSTVENQDLQHLSRFRMSINSFRMNNLYMCDLILSVVMGRKRVYCCQRRTWIDCESNESSREVAL
jgi:hypothetical protein